MKLVMKILPLFLLVSSLSSCGANKQITVTIDSGLGYFTRDYEANVLDYVFNTLKVNKGSRFCDLNFEEPYMLNDSLIQGDFAYPIFYTINGKQINSDYIINSDVVITAHYFSSLAEVKNAASSIYMQGIIGAIKRCMLSGKPFIDVINFSQMLNAAMTRYQCDYPCIALGSIGAAIADAYGETQKLDFIPIFSVMDQQLARFDNQCASALSTGFQGIVGAIKRIFLQPYEYNQKWWQQFVIDSANAVNEAGPGNAHLLSSCIAAIANFVGEKQFDEDPNSTIMIKFIFKAFALVKNQDQAFELQNATLSFIGDAKRQYPNNFNILFNAFQALVANILR